MMHKFSTPALKSSSVLHRPCDPQAGAPDPQASAPGLRFNESSKLCNPICRYLFRTFDIVGESL